MTERAGASRRSARDEFWRKRALQHAAHIVRDISEETGRPISAAVQRVLDEEARENVKTA